MGMVDVATEVVGDGDISGVVNIGSGGYGETNGRGGGRIAWGGYRHEGHRSDGSDARSGEVNVGDGNDDDSSDVDGSGGGGVGVDMKAFSGNLGQVVERVGSTMMSLSALVSSRCCCKCNKSAKCIRCVCVRAGNWCSRCLAGAPVTAVMGDKISF